MSSISKTPKPGRYGRADDLARVRSRWLRDSQYRPSTHVEFTPDKYRDRLRRAIGAGNIVVAGAAVELGDAFFAGNGGTVAGNGRTVAGNGGTVAGNESTVAGNGRTVAGNGGTVAGNGRTFAGHEDRCWQRKGPLLATRGPLTATEGARCWQRETPLLATERGVLAAQSSTAPFGTSEDCHTPTCKPALPLRVNSLVVPRRVSSACRS